MGSKAPSVNNEFSTEKGIGPDVCRTTSTGKGDIITNPVRYRNRTGNEIDVTTVQPGTDKVYEAKVSLLNQAILDLGMGKYQWIMALLTGFGWYTDNVSPQANSISSTNLPLAVLASSDHSHISPFVQREFVVKRIACMSTLVLFRYITY